MLDAAVRELPNFTQFWSQRHDVASWETFQYGLLKRCIDLCLVTLTLPAILVAVLLSAALVMIGTRGPVFFAHHRLGLKGRFFSMWKFRTMCVDPIAELERYLKQNPAATEEWHKTHRLQHDPRVTTIGRFLRQTCLDALPQFWNVLIGDMSFVGPHPINAAEVEKYGSDFLFYSMMKPGITGLWQTSGRYSLSYQERVALDRFYAENWSLWLDIKILIRTVTPASYMINTFFPSLVTLVRESLMFPGAWFVKRFAIVTCVGIAAFILIIFAQSLGFALPYATASAIILAAIVSNWYISKSKARHSSAKPS